MLERMSRRLGAILTMALVCAGPVLLAPAAHAGNVEVYRAQVRLADLGCSPGGSDGLMDSRTKSALIRFQAANKVNQSGQLTTWTKQVLYSASPIHCNRRPVPANSGTGKRIVVSQRQNYVWLINSKGSVVLQAPMVDNPNYLPTGVFYTGSYCGGAGHVRYGYTGAVQLDWFTRFRACGFGFHRVPVYKGTNTQIHPDWWLGTNFDASHGCIRVTNAVAKSIYYFTSSTTKVVYRTF